MSQVCINTVGAVIIQKLVTVFNSLNA